MQKESVERPMMCRLDAFTPEQARRHATLWERIGRQARGIGEMNAGYQVKFQLDDRLFVRLAEFITLERLCCPFLDFGLEMFPEQETILLRLSGGEGVKAFLQHELKAVLG